MRTINRGFDNSRAREDRRGIYTGLGVAAFGVVAIILIEGQGYRGSRTAITSPEINPEKPVVTQAQDPNTLLRSVLLKCASVFNGRPLVAYAEGEIGTKLREEPDMISPDIKPALPAKEPVFVEYVLQLDFPAGTEFWALDPMETSPGRRTNRGARTRYAFMATQSGDEPMVQQMTFDELTLAKCEPVEIK